MKKYENLEIESKTKKLSANVARKKRELDQPDFQNIGIIQCIKPYINAMQIKT